MSISTLLNIEARRMKYPSTVLVHTSDGAMTKPAYQLQQIQGKIHMAQNLVALGECARSLARQVNMNIDRMLSSHTPCEGDGEIIEVLERIKEETINLDHKCGNALQNQIARDYYAELEKDKKQKISDFGVKM